MSTPTLPAKATWQNWAQNESFETRLVEPRSESEIVEFVKSARSRHEELRAVGTGHSGSPLLRNNGMLLSLDNVRGVISTDAARSRAVVHSGTKIRELGDALWESGISLTNQGGIDRQSIAGAIATGTHGTGLSLKNLSSSLRRARIVTGTGEVVEVDESTPDELHAAQVSMGMLGVMTEIELQLSPAYELTDWTGFVPFDDVAPHGLELARRNRGVSLFWFPTHRAAARWHLVPPSGDGSDMCFVRVYSIDGVDAGPIAGYGEVRRVDRAYRIYPDDWEPQFYEMEYMMPVEAGLECWPKVRQMILSEFPENLSPVELRFTAADEAFLSQNYGRDSAIISVQTEATGRPSEDFFGRCDELFTEHDGRPHWGKLHYTSVDRLRSQFPRYDKFREIRRRFDPNGVFLNEYLEPLFA